MRKWVAPEPQEELSAADVASALFLREFAARHPARKPLGVAAQAVKMLLAGQGVTRAKKNGSVDVVSAEENDHLPDRQSVDFSGPPDTVRSPAATAAVVPSGLQRRVISVGRALSSFALEAAAVMNDGAVESVLYLPTNEDVDAVNQRLNQPDVASLRLTVIPVAKRIGEGATGEDAAEGGGGGLDEESFAHARRGTGGIGRAGGIGSVEGGGSESVTVSAPSTTSDDANVVGFHDAGDEWQMNQPSPPPAPVASPPPPSPPPPTPRAAYMGVKSSSLDYDGCAMVVTPASGTDQSHDGAGPEVDFCKDYGQVVLVRISGDEADMDVDVARVLSGMQAMIRLGLTRAVMFETSGTDRTLSGAAMHFRDAPYNVYLVGRYDALRTAGTAGVRTKDQPSLVRIDGEYYRPLLEELLPSAAVKTVLAVRRDDEFVASALRYGLTVCDASCGCKVPEDKPCGDATTASGAAAAGTGEDDADGDVVIDRVETARGRDGVETARGRDSVETARGRDSAESQAMRADAAAAAAVAAAAEKGAAAALAAADRSSGVLDPPPVVVIRAEEELRAGALLEDDPVNRKYTSEPSAHASAAAAVAVSGAAEAASAVQAARVHETGGGGGKRARAGGNSKKGMKKRGHRRLSS